MDFLDGHVGMLAAERSRDSTVRTANLYSWQSDYRMASTVVSCSFDLNDWRGSLELQLTISGV
jgi:hypothetical protein